MLHVTGQAKRLCDGITRRDLMQVGGLSLFSSLTLPRLLAAAGEAKSKGPLPDGKAKAVRRGMLVPRMVRNNAGRNDTE